MKETRALLMCEEIRQRYPNLLHVLEFEVRGVPEIDVGGFDAVDEDHDPLGPIRIGFQFDCPGIDAYFAFGKIGRKCSATCHVARLAGRREVDCLERMFDNVPMVLPVRSSDSRAVSEEDDGATILHVDMDAFFASVELAQRPGLRGRPMVVAGAERSVVLAATYEARAFGIKSAMPIAQARSRLPSLVVVPPDPQRYRAVSRRVMEILGQVTPRLQQVSVDEAFLDVAGARRRLGSPSDIGAGLRRTIHEELGLSASIGAASTLSVAKIASQRAKPDGMLVIPESATVEFLHSLDVGALWGVGGATERRLAELGIRTIQELAHTPMSALVARLGKASAQRLHELAWGRDPRRVEVVHRERSISAEHTFPRDVARASELERVLLEQSHRCARRLRSGGLVGSGVTIKVRMADFTTLTRSKRLTVPSDVAHDVYTQARALLAGIEIPSAGVRLIGVRIDDVSPSATTPVQGALGEDDEARRAVEVALDRVGQRFGDGVVAAASLLPVASNESVV